MLFYIKIYIKNNKIINNNILQTIYNTKVHNKNNKY
jgi:hypothetical protein